MYIDFRIAIIKNGLKIRISDDLEEWADYEAERSGFRLVFKEYDTTLPITHESFGIRTVSVDKQQELWGLKDIQETVRALDIIPRHLFHAVVFLYDFDQSEFERAHPGAAVAHWTRFGELYEGTEFIEVATTKAWDKKGDVFRVLTHEIRHAYVNRARRKGLPVVDYMDLSPVLQNGKLDWIPYYLEFAPYDRDGNRAIQDRTLQAYWEKIAAQPALDLLVTRIMNYIMPKTTFPPKIIAWAGAVKEHEGWYPGSRSYRNNNPANAKFVGQKNTVGRDDKGFAIFKSYQDGLNYLCTILYNAAAGKSKVYRPNMTLLEWAQTYAPASDNNDSDRYAQVVAAKIGVSVNTKLKDLLA